MVGCRYFMGSIVLLGTLCVIVGMAQNAAEPSQGAEVAEFDLILKYEIPLLKGLYCEARGSGPVMTTCRAAILPPSTTTASQ